MGLFDNTVGAIEKAMDLYFKRHAVITGNIANSETPNYRAREIDFAGELQKAVGKDVAKLSGQAVEKTNPMHMDLSSNSNAHIVFDDRGAMGADGNNVDLDISMGKLSSNARAYGSLATMMSIKFRLLRDAVQNRGGS